MMDSIPSEILGIIFDKLQPVELMVLCDVSKRCRAAASPADLRGRRLVEEAVRSGYDHLVEYALSIGSTPTTYAIALAAKAGNVSVIKLLDTDGIVEKNHYDMLKAAFLGGQLEVIKYLHEFRKIAHSTLQNLVVTYPHLHIVKWIFATFEKSSERRQEWTITGIMTGNVEIAEFICGFYNRPATGPDCSFWAGSHNLEMTKWYIRQNPQCRMTSIYRGAVDMDHIHILEWLDSSEYKITYTAPIIRKSIELLDWYHTNGYTIGNVYCAAVRDPVNIQLMDWAYAHGMRLSHQDLVMSRQTKKIIQWVITNQPELLTPHFIENRMSFILKTVRLLHDNGYNMLNHIDAIAKRGSSDALEWVLEQTRDAHIPLSSSLHTHLAHHGDSRKTKMLVEYGCPLTADVFADVILLRDDRRDIQQIIPKLTILRKLNCPWDSRVCLMANIRQHTELLKWIHENGCPCCSTCTWRKDKQWA